jgi:hypothetical protein
VFAIELDTMDVDDNGKFAAYLKKHKIVAKMVSEEGPGGGWPVVRYNSENEQALKAMITRFFEDDWLWELIEKV